MNFYYDPILGLQYTYLGDILQFDLIRLPKDLNVNKFIEDWKRLSSQIGIEPLELYPCAEIILKITNYKL